MGESPTVSVDVDALGLVAQQFEAARDAIDSIVGQHVVGLAFDGADGGRDHVAGADAVHDALARLTSGLAGWARACGEIAVALRDGATRYADAEAAAADRLS